MPANLPPQYFETEKKLKTTNDPVEKIEIMEELLSIIPKHKGTEKLQALYKKKISKLKSKSQKKSVTARHEPSYHIDKSGAGQVVLIGPPNSGKSMLIKSLTNAEPEVADYPFTTHKPYPAMMKYENVQVQLIDTPPITKDYLEVWHTELIKNADTVLLVIDITSRDPAEDITVIQDVLGEKKIVLSPENNEKPTDKKQSRFQKKCLVVLNKDESPQNSDVKELIKELIETQFSFISCSAAQNKNLKSLSKRIFDSLEVMRVYSKIPGKKPSYDEPFIFKHGSSVMDMAKAVHKDFAQNFKYARIWGQKKYEGQKVNKEYKLQDGDVIELHM
ncbi:MAG: TGS domain-containing protein [Candidatus Aminicenantes bacterium]|nr:TGS domain-containing protein [Candidatus Aminicenantes bacterium]